MDKINYSYRSLRRAIGILGIALPILLIIGNHGEVEKSISYFYYTKMSAVFTGVLIAFGLVLCTYRGSKLPNEKISENVLTTIAGFCALLVALVPTRSEDGIDGLFYMHDDLLRGSIHYIAAAVFILLMGLVVLFKFTQAPYYKKFYKVMGIIVLIGWVFAIFAFAFQKLSGNILFKGDIFWGESVSLWAFGFAWLRRGVPQNASK
jgi:hypothetical protein